MSITTRFEDTFLKINHCVNLTLCNFKITSFGIHPMKKIQQHQLYLVIKNEEIIQIF